MHLFADKKVSAGHVATHVFVLRSNMRLTMQVKHKVAVDIPSQFIIDYYYILVNKHVTQFVEHFLIIIIILLLLLWILTSKNITFLKNNIK